MCRKPVSLTFLVLILVLGCGATALNAEAPRAPGGDYTNSLGMKLIRIEAGDFMMGIKEPVPSGGFRSKQTGRRVGEPLDPAMWKGLRPGLIGAVVNNGDASDLRTKQVLKSIDLDWTSQEAKKKKLARKSARWRGLLQAPVTGVVTLTVEANANVRILIDHELAVDVEGKDLVHSANVLMVKGKFTAIAIDTESTGYTRLYWSWAGQNKVLVPADALWHSSQDENMANAFMNWMSRRRKRGGGGGKTGGDYDEVPRHKVTISNAFYMSETEVTISQFRQFQAEYPGYEKFKPYASSVTWDDATAFCKWLSEKEGKHYRLPTEAEWEYACRAGTETAFSSGDKFPDHETANGLGLKNMHTGVREWCSDWYAVYPEEAQVDPVGPAHGWMKIVRGGNLDWTQEGSYYHARSTNRGAVAPNFGPPPLEYQFKQLQNAKLTYNIPKQLEDEAHRQYKIERLDDTNVTLNEARNTPFRYTGLAGRWSIKTSGFIPGRHEIGFRVVQAETPKTDPRPFKKPFVHRHVKQSKVKLEQGPDPEKPYYRTRLAYPNFNRTPLTDVWQLGVEQGYGGGHHNSALQVLPNGDLMAGYYNTIFGGERSPCVSIMSMRFRRGADEWDMPSSWPDNVDSDDEGPVIWNDNGTLWFFWGSPRQMAGYPFQYVKSTDNGATWSSVVFPLFDKRVGPYAAQPINSALRDSKGTVYLAVDGSHSPLASELFATRNEGRTWYDTGGRTFGRHSTFVLLDNDVIMAYAGKQASINGFQPQNVTRDGGRTYEITPSPLPAIGGGRRASTIKLASGKLFYVGDMQLREHRKLTPEQAPPGYTGDGAYVGLSGDDGKTWWVRKLVGGNVLDKEGKPVRVQMVSYVTATQSPDGRIHIISSHNHPDLHYEFNEAWILQKHEDTTPPVGKDTTGILRTTVKQYSENYPDGKVKVTWSAGTGQDGRYLLHGVETWYYQNGQKQWEVNFNAGRRTGTETYWFENGFKQWQKVYAGDGTYEWTNWKADGMLRAKSQWRGRKLLSHKIAGS